MADRLSQYSMAHNFPPGAQGMMQHHQLSAMQRQQQQQQQQQQSGQQQDSQPHPGMSGFENRAWSQMQQQMHQMRAQNGQDMNNAPSTQQMADLLRSQNMARMQSQQQQFGLGMGGSGPGQQQSFLDQSSQNQHNMQMGFPGMDQQAPSYQQSMQNRQSMLQTLNQGHNRQLELMGLAQNQQNQNGPINRALSQNGGIGVPPLGLNSLQPPNDIFSAPNDAIRRPSPSHPPSQPPLMGNQPPNANGMPRSTMTVQGRTINLGDLTDRASSLRGMIQQQELQMRSLQQQRAGMPDSIFMAKMRTLQGDINSRKESLNKIMTLMNICMQNGNGSISSLMPPNQGPSGPPGNGGQPWPQAPFGNSAQPPNHPPSQPQLPPGQRSSPSPAHPQANHPLNTPASVPPRSVPTPHQPLNPSFPMNPGNLPGSPINFPNNAPGSGAPGPSNSVNAPAGAPVGIPPLDKQRFETSYKQWCLTKAIVHDHRLLSIDNRPIDLYQLHCHVIREGGFANVNSKDLWSVVGGRLGFVHLPGNATEPARSGPAAAQHISHVYREYLSAFDTVYMTSLMDNTRKMRQFPGNPGNLNGPPIPNGPLPISSLKNFMPNQMRMIVACADKSAAELRSRGMSENIIGFIENNRANLQLMAADEKNFQSQIRPGQGSPPGPGGGAPPLGQPPFNSQQHHVGMPPQQFPGMPHMKPGNPPGAQQPPHNGALPPRPTREQINVSQISLNRLKAEYATRVVPMMPPVEVPLEQRVEYNSLLDAVLQAASDLDTRLAVYSILTKSEDNTKKLLGAIVSVQTQKSYLGSPNPRFIVSYDTLRIFYNQMTMASRHINSIVQSLMKGDHPQGPSADQPNNGGPGGPGGMPPRPPHPNALHHPSPPQIPPQPNPPQTQTSRPPMPLKPPPQQTKKASGAVSTPTPPASAATPVASAPTPTPAAASPQTPKSPKGKAPAKPKTTKRKVSKATPVIEPAQIPAPATSHGVNKRPREEEAESSQPPAPVPGPSSAPTPASAVANEPSPPKRVKTESEWEGPISEALQKKQEQVESIKTEEDATQFLEQMTELIKMAGSEDQAALSEDISETLEQILKGYGGVPETDSANTFSSLGLGEVGGSSLDSTASTSQLPTGDFAEFFDFSMYGNDDEDESKVDTPDLISSSSTNPSPESQSGSDADPAHHATALLNVKQEEYDPLRLGTLKEVDGGESAYYSSTDWKWDGQMATLEQPWAIFNS